MSRDTDNNTLFLDELNFARPTAQNKPRIEFAPNLRGKVDEGVLADLEAAASEMDEVQAAHQEAFRLIENPVDWRAPIDALIEEKDYERCAEACVFFTATELEIKSRISIGGRTMVNVTAVGYRNGPAGP